MEEVSRLVCASQPPLYLLGAYDELACILLVGVFFQAFKAAAETRVMVVCKYQRAVLVNVYGTAYACMGIGVL